MCCKNNDRCERDNRGCGRRHHGGCERRKDDFECRRRRPHHDCWIFECEEELRDARRALRAIDCITDRFFDDDCDGRRDHDRDHDRDRDRDRDCDCDNDRDWHKKDNCQFYGRRDNWGWDCCCNDFDNYWGR